MKKDRHATVETICQWCGTVFTARRERVEKGQSRFCSREHHREWRKSIGSQRKNIGKENAIIQWDKTKNMYVAYWHEPDTMKYKSEPWARWTWELNFGEVPENYYVSYKDGNSENAIINNICLKTMDEISGIGDRNRGVPKSESTRKKLSAAHIGKKLSKEHKKHISESNMKKWAEGVFDTVHLGEHHVRWRGGVKYLKYPREYYTIRRWIIERDNETCQICGKDASRKGQVHHIDGNKNHNTEDNLILLCTVCHNRVHSRKPDIASIMAFRAMLEWNRNDA